MDQPEISRLTRALRHGIGQDDQHRAVVPAWYGSSNYTFPTIAEEPDYAYSRSGNPTRDLFGEALATLEGGAGTVVTSSGMSAATLAVLALVPAGGRVVAAHDLYGGTWRLLNRFAADGRLQVDWVDLTDLDAARAALATEADLVWVESPSNPLLRITDIAAVCELGHTAGAKVLADNTFCSPVLQQPLSMGADLVLHSTTKFINGHSDVVGGALVSATEELHADLDWWANTTGVSGSSFDAWLQLRGLRTLDARMRVHQENAAAVVELLVDHPAVTRVHYPGLPDHPGHELATRQQSGFGSLISFEVAGGRAATEALVDGLRTFCLAESLGGVESLVVHPAAMTHAAMSDEALGLAGISQGLLRLSVGIEQSADLVADLAAGLDRAAAVTG
ncbi:cystathionine gamma-synthase [Propionibacteriaceae bacterium Y1923]|uniref:cystathionine gamma-synthase n=1 Tax=Aestuariimicrobium sp. Y1814 TaxID=3418742 RepID=UPI003C169131